MGIEWLCEDAKKFNAEMEYDAAICLCEGAFGLLLKDEDPVLHDAAILRNIHKALKPRGKLILSALNGLAKVRAAMQEDIVSGKFDPLTLVERYSLGYVTPDGESKEAILHEHGFLPGELLKLCKDTGFTVEQLWSGTAGNWRRQIFDLDEIEIMVIACKY